MSDIVWLASENVSALPVSGALGRSACALGKGEGPFLNQKVSPNEDSVFIVERHGQMLAGVADSHFGHQAGERLVLNLLHQIEEGWPRGMKGVRPTSTAAQRPAVAWGQHNSQLRASQADSVSLREAVLRADEQGASSVRDRSRSTLLVALVTETAAHWVSIGDSMLYLVTSEGIRAVNTPTGVFGGGSSSLRGLQQRAAAAGIEVVVENGSIECSPGDLLVLCTDGILQESSGMSIRDLDAAMRRGGSLLQRTADLALRACSREQGGGRDNVGIVAVEFP